MTSKTMGAKMDIEKYEKEEVLVVASIVALLIIAMCVMFGSAFFIRNAHGQAMPVPKTGSCPSGYTQSGGYCAPMSTTRRRAIPKGNGQCPSGYFQSGSYCLEMVEERR